MSIQLFKLKEKIYILDFTQFAIVYLGVCTITGSHNIRHISKRDRVVLKK